MAAVSWLQKWETEARTSFSDPAKMSTCSEPLFNENRWSVTWFRSLLFNVFHRSSIRSFSFQVSSRGLCKPAARFNIGWHNVSHVRAWETNLKFPNFPRDVLSFLLEICRNLSKDDDDDSETVISKCNFAFLQSFLRCSKLFGVQNVY